MSEGMAWAQVKSDAAQLNREMDAAIAGLEDMRNIVAGRPLRRAGGPPTNKASPDAMSITKGEQIAGGDVKKERGTYSDVLRRYETEEESGTVAAAGNTSAPLTVASSERRPRGGGGTYSSVLRRYEQSEVAEKDLRSEAPVKSKEVSELSSTITGKERRHSEAAVGAVLQKYSGKQVRHGRRARSSDQSSVRSSMSVTLDSGTLRQAEGQGHRKGRPVFDLPNEVKPLPRSNKMLGRRRHEPIGKELYRPDIYS